VLIRRLAIASLAGQAVWVAIVVVAGLLEPGFPFPADCRWSIDAGCRARETAGEVSWQHVAHGWAYFLGAIAILLSVLAMAWRFRGDSRWGRADLLALGSALLGLAIFAALFFITGNEMHGHYGVVQRLSLAAGGLWVAALAIGLLAIYGRPADPAVRLVEWIRRSVPGGRLVVQPGSGLETRRTG
jgi:Protein of unknown function (DUF998)